MHMFAIVDCARSGNTLGIVANTINILPILALVLVPSLSRQMDRLLPQLWR